MTRQLDRRIVYLSRQIPHYQERIMQSISAAVTDFRIVASEPQRPSEEPQSERTGLSIDIQRSLKLPIPTRHEIAGFAEMIHVDFPYDTGRRLKQLRPDVVVSVELGMRSISAARYRRQNRASRLLLCTFITPHTEQHRGWIRRTIRPRLFDIADAITYNGPLCRQYLEDYGVPSSKLFHFPYAANDLTTYNGPVERHDSATRRRLLCVGQLVERKGVVPLAHQLCEYSVKRPARQIEITFVGDGPQKKELRSIDTPANLELHVLGYVRPEELPVLMGTHGAGISGTLADEWLLPVDEALHAGLPFIGSIYAQAVTTLVQKGKTGWHFDPKEPHSLTEVLDAYFDATPGTITQMRHDARKSVADITPERAARGLLEAVEYVLRGTG